jgi:plasmid stabilization system protein ParE
MLDHVQLKLAAVQDLAEAYAWYEQQRPGLGNEFLEAVRLCLDSAARHPRSNAIARKNVRRALVRRFPYSVYYEASDDAILVRGIFHHARKPASWQKRLRENDP